MTRAEARPCNGKGDRGEPCHDPGTLTESTYGFGGKDGSENQRWYCARHFPAFDGRYVNEAKPKVRAVDLSALNDPKLKPIPGDPKNWARAVLTRHAKGEAVPGISVACALAYNAQQAEIRDLQQSIAALAPAAAK